MTRDEQIDRAARALCEVDARHALGLAQGDTDEDHAAVLACAALDAAVPPSLPAGDEGREALAPAEAELLRTAVKVAYGDAVGPTLARVVAKLSDLAAASSPPTGGEGDDGRREVFFVQGVDMHSPSKIEYSLLGVYVTREAAQQVLDRVTHRDGKQTATSVPKWASIPFDSVEIHEHELLGEPAPAPAGGEGQDTPEPEPEPEWRIASSHALLDTCAPLTAAELVDALDDEEGDAPVVARLANGRWEEVAWSPARLVPGGEGRDADARANAGQAVAAARTDVAFSGDGEPTAHDLANAAIDAYLAASPGAADDRPVRVEFPWAQADLLFAHLNDSGCGRRDGYTDEDIATVDGAQDRLRDALLASSPPCPRCGAAMHRETYEADDSDYTSPSAPAGAYRWDCTCGHEGGEMHLPASFGEVGQAPRERAVELVEARVGGGAHDGPYLHVERRLNAALDILAELLPAAPDEGDGRAAAMREAECSCTSTEASMRRCPVHGEDAPAL